MESLITNLKDLSLENRTMKVKITFYTGWSWLLTESKKIKREKLIDVKILDVNDNYITIKTNEPEFFSWSNGPTLPQQQYALFKDGTMGYFLNNELFKWNNSQPTWSIV